MLSVKNIEHNWIKNKRNSKIIYIDISRKNRSVADTVKSQMKIAYHSQKHKLPKMKFPAIIKSVIATNFLSKILSLSISWENLMNIFVWHFIIIISHKF